MLDGSWSLVKNLHHCCVYDVQSRSVSKLGDPAPMVNITEPFLTLKAPFTTIISFVVSVD